MIKFHKVIIAVIVFLVLLVLSTNMLLRYAAGDNGSKYYMVEINRAYDDIITSGFRQDMDLSGYQYLKRVSYLPADADSGEIRSFYENSGDSYIIKTLGGDETTGYVKFTYVLDMNAGYSNMIAAVNVCIGVLGTFIIVVLFYIKIQIIKPFNEIHEMPYALSKGHLTQELKENKSRYFGRFVWGLDMLRESLQAHKNKELALAKEKKTMVLGLSHDIKTPLYAIKLYTKALSENLYEDEEKRQKIVGHIEEKADEIEGFVQEIIKTSREDFLHIEDNNSEFYLDDLVERLRKYYGDKLAYIKVGFEIRPFENCLIYGDIERSIELFENIIENAIKYGDGKSITLSFDREEGCQLITVTNTGSALPADEMVHIWDSFWRGSNAGDKSGSGLGLYICRQIVTKMKGDIYAAAEDGNMSITVVLKML